jgi:hypothetical protein
MNFLAARSGGVTPMNRHWLTPPFFMVQPDFRFFWEKL